MPLHRHNIAGIVVDYLINCPTGRCTGTSAFRIGFFKDNDPLVPDGGDRQGEQCQDAQPLFHVYLLLLRV